MDGASGPGLRRRVRQATVRLEAAPSSVLDLEAFLDGLPFLGPRERDRMKLAGDEILDNLVRHASPLRDGSVIARAARRSDRLILAFYFRSEAFAGFASLCDDLDPLFEPLFDPEDRRWRGIGLHMCRNLSSGMRMCHGALLDRIYLSFAPDPLADRPPESTSILAAK